MVIEFHFDIGSPNAYLVHKVIPAVTEETGIEFDYVPILLGGVPLLFLYLFLKVIQKTQNR